MKASMASAGLASHRSLKACSVMPDTREKSVNACPPVSTATCILMIALLNAVPPASASSPTDESAVAKPKICG